jgi:glycosyltransferase involved in cell wall biosynthesis
VVVPNYNDGASLPLALRAIVEQSLVPLEVLVIDDASTDLSVEIVQRFSEKYPFVRLVRNSHNLGVITSMNVGMRIAKGDYVFFPSANDRVFSGFFERSMELLAKYPQAALCSAQSRIVRGNGNECVVPLNFRAPDERFLSTEEAQQLLLARSSWILGNTCIYRRDALVQEGGFRRELAAFCDGFIGIVLALRYGACFIPVPFAVWVQSGGGYAERCVSDFAVAEQMWSNAARLMRTEYKDLFPAAYVDKWERQKLCHARWSAIRRLQREQEAVIDGFFLPASRIDRVTVLVIKVSSRIGFGLFAMYLLLRLRAPMLSLAVDGLRGMLARGRQRFQSWGYRRRPA